MLIWKNFFWIKTNQSKNRASKQYERPEKDGVNKRTLCPLENLNQIKN